jgi:hypothetical protein
MVEHFLVKVTVRVDTAVPAEDAYVYELLVP